MRRQFPRLLTFAVLLATVLGGFGAPQFDPAFTKGRPLILQANFPDKDLMDADPRIPTRIYGTADPKEELLLVIAIKRGGMKIESFKAADNSLAGSEIIREWNYTKAPDKTTDEQGLMEWSTSIKADDQGSWSWKGAFTVSKGLRAEELKDFEFVPGAANFSITICSAKDVSQCDVQPDVHAGDVWLVAGGADMVVKEPEGFETISFPQGGRPKESTTQLLATEFVRGWHERYQRPAAAYIITADSEKKVDLEDAPWKKLNQSGSLMPGFFGVVWCGGALRAEYWDQLPAAAGEKAAGASPARCKESADAYSRKLVDQEGKSGQWPNLLAAICGKDTKYQSLLRFLVAQLPSAGGEPQGLRYFPWEKRIGDPRDDPAKTVWSKYYQPYSSWAEYRDAQATALERLRPSAGRARLVPLLSEIGAGDALPGFWVWPKSSQDGGAAFSVAAKRLMDAAADGDSNFARVQTKVKRVLGSNDLELTVADGLGARSWKVGDAENFEVTDDVDGGKGWVLAVKLNADGPSTTPVLRIGDVSKDAKWLRYAWRDTPGKLSVLETPPPKDPNESTVRPPSVVLPPFKIKIE